MPEAKSGTFLTMQEPCGTHLPPSHLRQPTLSQPELPEWDLGSRQPQQLGIALTTSFLGFRSSGVS